VTVGDLQALVTDSDQLGPDPSAENMLAHQQMLAAIMAQGTVVPFAFGTVLAEADLLRILQQAGQQLQELLAELAGKIEVGLKLIWKKEHFLADIETQEITALHHALSRAPQRTDSAVARIGEMLQQAADDKREHYRQLIYEPLAAAAAGARLNETAGPRMILNAAFLVERSREAAFDQRVGEVCRPHQERLEVRYTGPWPAYSFVTLKLAPPEGG
jgi:hypothetical protein